MAFFYTHLDLRVLTRGRLYPHSWSWSAWNVIVLVRIHQRNRTSWLSITFFFSPLGFSRAPRGPRSTFVTWLEGGREPWLSLLCSFERNLLYLLRQRAVQIDCRSNAHLTPVTFLFPTHELFVAFYHRTQRCLAKPGSTVWVADNHSCYMGSGQLKKTNHLVLVNCDRQLSCSAQRVHSADFSRHHHCHPRGHNRQSCSKLVSALIHVVTMSTLISVPHL